MDNVIMLQNYSNKRDVKIESYSIIDMIFDSEKRKEVYDYYDSMYKDTDEEKEIFKEMQNRRMGRY